MARFAKFPAGFIKHSKQALPGSHFLYQFPRELRAWRHPSAEISWGRLFLEYPKRYLCLGLYSSHD